MERCLVLLLLLQTANSVSKEGFDFVRKPGNGPKTADLSTNADTNTRIASTTESKHGATVSGTESQTAPDVGQSSVVSEQQIFDNTDHGETTVIVENDGKGDDESETDADANLLTKNNIAGGPTADAMEGYTIVLDNSNSERDATKQKNDLNYRTLTKSFHFMEKQMQDMLRNSSHSNAKRHFNRAGLLNTTEHVIEVQERGLLPRRPRPTNGDNEDDTSDRLHNHGNNDKATKDFRDVSPGSSVIEVVHDRMGNKSFREEESRPLMHAGQFVKPIVSMTPKENNTEKRTGEMGEEREANQPMISLTPSKKESIKQEAKERPTQPQKKSSNRQQRRNQTATLSRRHKPTELPRPTVNRTQPSHYGNHYAAQQRPAMANQGGSEGVFGDRPAQMVVNPKKAQAMIEYLNKDPLESWIYHFDSLKNLGINSTMLRNGLVNPGSINRLKEVMRRALLGQNVTMSIVGGSISAGGGLYKDRGNIDGLYYKAIVDWWAKIITPLTGSHLNVNNVAIGSIGTDYFSYCLRNHVRNDTDMIFWELSGNDYNRYVKQPTKGARPLERLTRVILTLPKRPALIFVNFFKGIDYRTVKTRCPDFEDQGENIIAHYYDIPSLSWRAMVCQSLMERAPLFTLDALFSNDGNHPSLRGHAQMALLLILHVRHVIRAVLQWAILHEGYIPELSSQAVIPPPLFIGLDHPDPLCWTLISPDMKENLTNSLPIQVMKSDGFKMEYATNFPIRYDRIICWKSERKEAELTIQFTIPRLNQMTGAPRNSCEVAITSHSRWGGKADVWLDNKTKTFVAIQEGRDNDTGKRTQVDVLSSDIETGVHTLHIRSVKVGFCLTSIMIQ